MVLNSSDKFSSSIIRENIKNGEMDKANFALGRALAYDWKIIEEIKRARKLIFQQLMFYLVNILTLEREFTVLRQMS